MIVMDGKRNGYFRFMDETRLSQMAFSPLVLFVHHFRVCTKGLSCKMMNAGSIFLKENYQ